jgi:hypothetical protein
MRNNLSEPLDRYDFGNDRDADFGRTRGADGKPYGATDLGELGLGKAGRAHPFEAPCMGYFGEIVVVVQDRCQ